MSSRTRTERTSWLSCHEMTRKTLAAVNEAIVNSRSWRTYIQSMPKQWGITDHRCTSSTAQLPTMSGARSWRPRTWTLRWISQPLSEARVDRDLRRSHLSMWVPWPPTEARCQAWDPLNPSRRHAAAPPLTATKGVNRGQSQSSTTQLETESWIRECISSVQFRVLLKKPQLILSTTAASVQSSTSLRMKTINLNSQTSW